jgi:hypothetical protein
MGGKTNGNGTGPDLVVAGVGVGPRATDRHDGLLKVRARPAWVVLGGLVGLGRAWAVNGRVHSLTRGPEVGPRKAHLDVRPGLVRRLAAVAFGVGVGWNV